MGWTDWPYWLQGGLDFAIIAGVLSIINSKDILMAILFIVVSFVIGAILGGILDLTLGRARAKWKKTR